MSDILQAFMLGAASTLDYWDTFAVFGIGGLLLLGLYLAATPR